MRGSAQRLAPCLALVATIALTPDERVRAQNLDAEQNLLLGVWQLDVAKSRYTPGPPPRNETRTYVRDKDGMKGTIERRRADGMVEVIEYRADFDHEYPVMGTPAYDTIQLKRIDAYTAEAVLSHAGRVFGTARRVVSQDGRTLTIMFRQEDRAGSLQSNVAVYRKQ
jgi:hypothetical protein